MGQVWIFTERRVPTAQKTQNPPLYSPRDAKVYASHKAAASMLVWVCTEHLFFSTQKVQTIGYFPSDDVTYYAKSSVSPSTEGLHVFSVRWLKLELGLLDRPFSIAEIKIIKFPSFLSKRNDSVLYKVFFTMRHFGGRGGRTRWQTNT